MYKATRPSQLPLMVQGYRDTRKPLVMQQTLEHGVVSMSHTSRDVVTKLSSTTKHKAATSEAIHVAITSFSLKNHPGYSNHKKIRTPKGFRYRRL